MFFDEKSISFTIRIMYTITYPRTDAFPFLFRRETLRRTFSRPGLEILGDSMNNETKFHSGFVALVGRPNVGKSTLMNALLGEKISIVSAHAQTTRNKITGVWNGENSQVVFLDTPGMHKPQSKLGEVILWAQATATSFPS